MLVARYLATGISLFRERIQLDSISLREYSSAHAHPEQDHRNVTAPVGVFFYLHIMQQFTKPVISIADQVLQLQKRGLIVEDFARAERYLMSLGYYRLSAYCFPFEVDKQQHLFAEGTTFDDVLSIYIFDRKLRCLFVEAMERIEIHLRAQWVNRLIQSTQNPFAHMERKNFNNQEKYIKQLSKLMSTLSSRQKEPYVKHFYEKYEESSPPLWSCVQLMSFGELATWVDITADNVVKKKIAQSVGFPDYKPFSSFVQSLIEVRNICAHHGRLWNKVLVKRHETIKTLHTNQPYIKSQLPIASTGKLFSIVLLVISALRAINHGTSWPVRLGELLEERTDSQLLEMGFPLDWRDVGLFSTEIVE